MGTSEKSRPVALTIAGSDSSGGAGIQADLKSFTIAGVHGASVITCITAQNTKGVQKIEPLSQEIIKAQLESVLFDLRPIAIKTGMLYSSDIVELIVEKLIEYNDEIHMKDKLILVVDPVLITTTGAELTDTKKLSGFLNTLKNKLFPISTIITPNLIEASKLLGWEVKSYDDMIKASKELYKFGSRYVLLKGGHRILKSNIDKDGDKDSAIDVLYNGEIQLFKAPKLAKDIHGTGCSFASLITGYLALGHDITNAVENAKKIITDGIVNSINIGDGVEVINPPSQVFQDIERYQIVSDLKLSLKQLLNVLKIDFVPEVGINIGYALPNAKSREEICALNGRIIRVGTGIDYLGQLEFGASKHVARIILTIMNFNKEFRSALNIKYKPEYIELCKKLGFSIGTFDRDSEPDDVSSMEWGTKTTIENLGYIPDIIYDTGGIGKEPMIRILGRDPGDVINKLRKIMNIFTENR